MSDFRKFFIRGLAIVLPTALTFYLIVLAYNFVDEKFAEPINSGLRELIIDLTQLPPTKDQHFDEIEDELSAGQQQAWSLKEDELKRQFADTYNKQMQITQKRNWMKSRPDVVKLARRYALERWWNSVRVGGWAVMDLIGLILAIILIYILGLLLTSYIGRRLYSRGEELIHRVPLIRKVYPSVKQVTDFFFGDRDQKITFNRVVAVEYPRKGLWSVGLVTGDTMRDIENQAGSECLTVFVPSSPTPFTGYVITVPKKDTIDLPVTIEEAFKFAVSGGVLIPPNQTIIEHKPLDKSAE